MQFEIDQSRFLSAITRASSVAAVRTTLPILSNVLLVCHADKLEVRSTDMTIALTESVACKVITTGSIAIGVRHLTNVVRTLPVGPVNVTGLDNNWAKISAKRSEFKIMGLPEGDFPELPEPAAIDFETVSAAKFSDMIGRVAFSICGDEARVNLNGALLESDGTTSKMVSTDGHRLTKFGADIGVPGCKKGRIIPAKGCAEIRKLIAKSESCQVGVSSDHMFVDADGVMLSVKLNNVKFPPWQEVVPKECTRVAEVSRDEFIASLRQAVVMAPEKTHSVKLMLSNGMIELHADNPELGGINLELPADYDGVALTTGFNGAYLIDALLAMSADRVLLELQGELDPITLRPVDDAVDFIAVVMPMRV